MRKKYTFVFLGLFLLTPALSLSQTSQLNEKKPAQISHDQCDIEYIEGLAGATQEIPKNFLDNVVTGINFALESGAAREIDRQDLFHAHILVQKNTPWNIKNTTNIMLLFHTQEKISYPGFYKLRNILLKPNGESQILPCALCLDKQLNFNDESICTINAKDLGRDNYSDVLFVPVSSCPPIKLKKYKNNIRIIGGRKILFRIFGPFKGS